MHDMCRLRDDESSLPSNGLLSCCQSPEPEQPGMLSSAAKPLMTNDLQIKEAVLKQYITLVA